MLSSFHTGNAAVVMKESASAAEELSAQAQSVNGLVDELVAMVEGNKNSRLAPSRP